MKISVPVFNPEGDIIDHEEIEVTELGIIGQWEGDFYKPVWQIELGDYTKAHPDDVIGTLDLHYGYFKYQIV